MGRQHENASPRPSSDVLDSKPQSSANPKSRWGCTSIAILFLAPLFVVLLSAAPGLAIAVLVVIGFVSMHYLFWGKALEEILKAEEQDETSNAP